MNSQLLRNPNWNNSKIVFEIRSDGFRHCSNIKTNYLRCQHYYFIKVLNNVFNYAEEKNSSNPWLVAYTYLCVIVAAPLLVYFNLLLPSCVQSFLSCPVLQLWWLLLGLLNWRSSFGGLDLLLVRAFRVDTFPWFVLCSTPNQSWQDEIMN